MRNVVLFVLALFLTSGAAAAASHREEVSERPLPWVYGVPTDGSTPRQPACVRPKDDGTLRRPPGSNGLFTLTQISDCSVRPLDPRRSDRVARIETRRECVHPARHVVRIERRWPMTRTVFSIQTR